MALILDPVAQGGGAEGEGGADQRELSPKRSHIENAGK